MQSPVQVAAEATGGWGWASCGEPAMTIPDAAAGAASGPAPTRRVRGEPPWRCTSRRSADTEFRPRRVAHGGMVGHRPRADSRPSTRDGSAASPPFSRCRLLRRAPPLAVAGIWEGRGERRRQCRNRPDPRSGLRSPRPPASPSAPPASSLSRRPRAAAAAASSGRSPPFAVAGI